MLLTTPATPLTLTRTTAGFFMSSYIDHEQSLPCTLHGQLDLLKKKGLVISNPDRVIHYLRFIAYFRLAGYFQPFLLPSGRFKENTSFDQVLHRYIFDRQLRLLVMDAVERIEVAIRTTISSTLIEQHGEHWYKDANLFVQKYDHQVLIKIIKKAVPFNNSLSQPIWIIVEELPVGVWSIIFKHLKSRDTQKKISNNYGLHYSVMESWLHSFAFLRNLCAHHSRLWNRTFTIQPKVPAIYKKQFGVASSFCAQAAVLNLFLSVIADGSSWQRRLRDLIQNNKEIPISAMGFSADWDADLFWRINR
jgi:abortive infection bacteriophage resistance protein